MEKVCFPVVFHGLYQTSYCNSRSISRLHSASGTSCTVKAIDTVEPLFYDHPQNHIGVVVKAGWSFMRGLT